MNGIYTFCYLCTFFSIIQNSSFVSSAESFHFFQCFWCFWRKWRDFLSYMQEWNDNKSIKFSKFQDASETILQVQVEHILPSSSQFFARNSQPLVMSSEFKSQRLPAQFNFEYFKISELMSALDFPHFIKRKNYRRRKVFIFLEVRLLIVAR